MVSYLTSLGSDYATTISDGLTTKSINITGLSLDAPYTFVVSALQSDNTVVSTATITASTSTPLINTPKTFSDIVATSVDSSINIASTPVTSLTNLYRYSISPDGGNFLTITDSYGITFESFSQGTSTYKDCLMKLFQAVQDIYNGELVSSLYFRFDSDYHTNYSLDVDSTGNLQFINNWGNGRVDGNGYVCFYYDGTYLQAIKRYKYDSFVTGYHVLDTSFLFANYYMSYSSSQFNLVATTGEATSFNVYSSPLSESIPASFNPSGIEYVTNTRVSINDSISNTIAEMQNNIAQDMMTKYQPQISTVGYNSDTIVESDLMLATIIESVSQQGSSLRYSTSLYKSFRETALQMTLKSNSVGNGTVGQNTIPYVYFTCEADVDASFGIAGTYHPFMCIASYGISDRPLGLTDIARPPGEAGVDYPEARVTRDSTMGYIIAKIPMLDYGTISDPTENTSPGLSNSNLLDDTGYTDPNKPSVTTYNYSSIKGAGIMIDGVSIFPTMNNRLNTAQFQGEISAHGHHVGRDLSAGLHYHADGHAGNNDSVFQIYNTSDYVDKSHPPLIGFSFDGIALFGIYDHDYDTMDGYSVDLDSFGGHTHGAYGYHYHSHDELIDEIGYCEIPSNGLYDYDVIYEGSQPDGLKYTVHVLLNGAWKGKIDEIPYFWSDSPSTGPFEPDINANQSTKYVGKETQVTPPPN